MHTSRRGTAAARLLSTHAIIDSALARRIVNHSGLAPPGLVFELGAGHGALTLEYAAAARKLVAVERSREAWLRLKAATAHLAYVEAVLGDALACPFPSRGRYSVVGNLPFALTAALLRRLTTLDHPPATIAVVVERDAALHWSGAGGSTVASVLAGVRFQADVRLAIHRSAFRPRPSVDAALLVLEARQRPLLPRASWRAFEAFVRREFGRGRPSSPPSARSTGEWVACFLQAAAPSRRRSPILRQTEEAHGRHP